MAQYGGRPPGGYPVSDAGGRLPRTTSSGGGFDFGDFLGDVGGVASSVIPFAGPVLSLLGGLFGESSEDQYNRAQAENLKRTIDAIQRSAALERASAAKLAEKNRRFARSSGARRRAAAGYGGDAGVFTGADLSNIDESLLGTLDNINTREQQGILFAGAQQQTMPSYMFPNDLDYITGALSGVGDVLEGRRNIQAQQEQYEEILRALRGIS